MFRILLMVILLEIFFFAGCQEVEPVAEEKVVRHYKGGVEILNSCGLVDAGVKMNTYLRKNGFDVKKVSNDRLQNNEETILVLRNPDWEGKDALATTLRTENILTIYSKRAMFDATIYIGKDFQKLIKED